MKEKGERYHLLLSFLFIERGKILFIIYNNSKGLFQSFGKVIALVECREVKCYVIEF